MMPSISGPRFAGRFEVTNPELAVATYDGGKSLVLSELDIKKNQATHTLVDIVSISPHQGKTVNGMIVTEGSTEDTVDLVTFRRHQLDAQGVKTVLGPEETMLYGDFKDAKGANYFGNFRGKDGKHLPAGAERTDFGGKVSFSSPKTFARVYLPLTTKISWKE
ncbi:MAG: hypothetical protein K2X01_05115 [Cyanobacteria bacterium]|nr:hypothetical protein [Cyanobacteriota bacterium]